MLRTAIFAVLLTLCYEAVGQTCQDDDKDDCSKITGTHAPIDQDVNWSSAKSIYDFHVRDIHGHNVSLTKYQGHVAIIVNVASQCGLTDKNYKQLVELYEKYGESKGLKILAFPSNQFGSQEPGTTQQILDFVKGYNVTFDVYDKVDVNGDNAHPLWKWLKTQADGFITNDIKWNFTKFVIDKQGKVVSRFAPTTDPLELESTLKQYF